MRFFLFFMLMPCIFAWGQVGHRVTGEIAWLHLNPEARAKATQLLEGRSLAMVANWPDEIRTDPAMLYTWPWHWVDYFGEEKHKRTRSPFGDIIEAMARFETILGNASLPDSARTTALKWLIHLVGDIHQPLHVGRPKDKGGNDLMVKWFDAPTNLHKVWDESLVEYQRLSYTEYANTLDFVSADQIQKWQKDTIYTWADESLALLDGVYAIGDGKLEYKYMGTHLNTVNQRLLQGGIRLAGVLNRLLGTKP